MAQNYSLPNVYLPHLTSPPPHLSTYSPLHLPTSPPLPLFTFPPPHLPTSPPLPSSPFHLSTQLSIHGVPKTRTWTRLASSARAGDEQIVLQGNDYPDWQVGEEVVIAASQWDPEEAEIRTISNYDANSGIRDTHTSCGRKLDHLHTCTSSQPHTHTYHT